VIASVNFMRLPPSVTVSNYDDGTVTVDYDNSTVPPNYCAAEPPPRPTRTIKDVAAYYMNRKGRRGRR